MQYVFFVLAVRCNLADMLSNNVKDDGHSPASNALLEKLEGAITPLVRLR